MTTQQVKGSKNSAELHQGVVFGSRRKQSGAKKSTDFTQASGKQEVEWSWYEDYAATDSEDYESAGYIDVDYEVIEEA